MRQILVSAELIDFLEAGLRLTPAGPGAVLEDSAQHVLLATEDQCIVQGIRIEEDAVENAVAQVRSFMRRHGARTGNWRLCERSTPSDLEERLRALGLTPAPHDYEIDGMMITSAPPPGPEEVEARPVATPEEYVAARGLLYEVFGIPPIADWMKHCSRRSSQPSSRQELASRTARGWREGLRARPVRSSYPRARCST